MVLLAVSDKAPMVRPWNAPKNAMFNSRFVCHRANLNAASEDIKVITERLERGEGKLGAWLKAKKSSKRKPKTKENKQSQPKQNF